MDCFKVSRRESFYLKSLLDNFKVITVDRSESPNYLNNFIYSAVFYWLILKYNYICCHHVIYGI